MSVKPYIGAIWLDPVSYYLEQTGLKLTWLLVNLIRQAIPASSL